MKRTFQHTWTCAGCAAISSIRIEVDERVLQRERNPAVFIANEKDLAARDAAQRHAKRGCTRPV